MKTTIKPIDVQAKEWFDKINGNSYFAGAVIINLGMDSEKAYSMPFQYGYGDQYRHEAFETLKNAGVLDIKNDREQLRQYAERNEIIVRYSIQRNCKKRELMNY